MCCVEGLVQTLDGLNIRNNPLEFPPPEVLQKGTRKILSYMRRLLQAKSDVSKTGWLWDSVIWVFTLLQSLHIVGLCARSKSSMYVPYTSMTYFCPRLLLRWVSIMNLMEQCLVSDKSVCGLRTAFPWLTSLAIPEYRHYIWVSKNIYNQRLKAKCC